MDRKIVAFRPAAPATDKARDARFADDGEAWTVRSIPQAEAAPGRAVY